MESSFEIRFLRYVRRHLLDMLMLLYLAPMIWGGFVPFDFKPHIATPIETAIVWGLPQAKAHLPDVLSNVALYLPLGLLVRIALIHRGWRRWTSLPASLVFGFALSYVTEWSQLYSVSRVSSYADFLANAGGFLIGALGASTAYVLIEAGREAGARLLEHWRDSWRARPVVAGAQVCAIGLFIAAVVPCDITFSPNRVIESVRATRLTPFSQDAKLSETVSDSAKADPDKRRSISSREAWMLGIEYLTTAALYALFAMFLYRYLSAHCRVADIRRGVWTVFVCGMVALTGSAAKLFVISRTADVTDLLVAVFGGAVGVLAADRFVHLWKPDSLGEDDRVRATRRRVVGAVLAGWCVLIAARELAPFDFEISASAFVSQLKSAEWLPMRAYQRAKLPVAVDDLLTKAFWFAGLGLLTAAWWRLRDNGRRLGIGAIALGAGASIAALEIVQLFMPARTPSITDVLVATIGAGIGAAAYRIVVTWLEEAQYAPHASRVLLNVDLPEREDAPREPSPARSPATDGTGSRDDILGRGL